MAQYIDKDKVIEYVKQRLIPTVNHGNIDDWERGADNERINFLSYINSLTEEPTVKGITWEDVNTLESLIYQVHNEYPSIGEKSFGLEVLERFQDCQDDIEEPISEDLEEEINYIGKNEYFDFSDWKSIARHFAEWQREKDIKLKKIDDLEVFAQKWAYSNYHQEQDEINCDCLYSGVKKGVEWYENHMKEILQTEYEKGRFDMREEIMKDAVNGEVVYQIGSSVIAPTDIRYKVISDRVYIPNVKLGDKVKIIIVKEEQQ